MIKHNQYYTSKNISDLVTRLIITSAPKTCLELSAGEGALLESAKKKWPNIHCTTFDIDPENVALLEQKFPTDNHFCADATGTECQSILESKNFDIAVCNPPFSMVTLNETTKNYLSKIFGDTYQSNTKIRSEILFFAINMLSLKANGTLAIIVPELIIKGYSFEKFRKKLTELFLLEYVIECEHNSFSKTEAKTYALIIKKSHQKTTKTYKYIKFNDSKLVMEETRDTMGFVSKQKRIVVSNASGYKIIRGNLSGKTCRNINTNYIHTTNMKSDFHEIFFEEKTDATTIISVKKAEAGDIIIARVGSRILGKTNLLISGSAILSDCVFALRFDNKNHKHKFLKFWLKNKDEWLKKNATGTCAKHITISNLSNLLDTLI